MRAEASRPDPASEVRRILDEEGIHAALGFLNARTAHRFTGVYRFDPPMLRNLHLFDRENPDLEIGADTPLRETYCSIVGETKEPFAAADTARDERVRDHLARDSVISYCGVLLRAEGGEPFGTLCHFDLRPRPVPEREIPVMESLAPLISEHVRRAGDPSRSA